MIEVLLTASIALMAAVFLAVFSTPVMAKVTGVCSNCHTMHNSQGGSNMQTGYDSGSDAQATLLRANGCLGCHGASDGATWQGVGGAPVVFNAGEPTFNATKGLAGGNFHWVATDANDGDTKGHNVFSDNPDGNLSEAPGRTQGQCDVDSCHYNLHAAYAGSGGLAGRQGCTKCHMVDDDDGPKGYHHADDSPTVINSFPWYRFLKGHNNGDGHGVSGIEDADWQQNPSSSVHNEYLGEAGGNTSNWYTLSLRHTMTAYCWGCHNDFHIQQDASGNWIRHPSDAVIPDSGEYAAYTTYNPQAPVARPSLSGWTGPANTVTRGAGGDMVMCLSCHRPHGSPYPDMLRWDYTDMVAGTIGTGQGNGCFVCHTDKDGA